MKKIIIFLIAAMSFSLATKAQTDVWDGTAVAWAQGDGTQANPYLIQSAENLAYLANLVNNGTSVAGDYYRLMVDIDLNGSQTFQWTPIGNATHSFSGNFDGNNHTISNLFINTSSLQYVGLFGRISISTIENLGIAGQSNITNTNNNILQNPCSGGIVGRCDSTVTIMNCYNKGNIASTAFYTGGIAGQCSSTVKIMNCYNTGHISSYASCSGGIVGQCSAKATIIDCYNKGPISDYSPSSGGIVGECYSADTITITNCYNSANITFLSSYSGGIVGHCYSTAKMTITSCYNTGDVYSAPSPSFSGGIAGLCNANVTIMNSYNIGNIYGCYRAGIAHGTGIITNSYYLDTSNTHVNYLSSSEMQTQSFVDMLNQGLATSVWRMDYTNHINNGFPILIWQSGTNGICGVNKENFLALKLYPNPANSRTNLYVNGLKNNADIIIYDINGREVKRLKINKSEKDIDIDLNGLAKGIYQVRVIDNSISTTKKLIVR